MKKFYIIFLIFMLTITFTTISFAKSYSMPKVIQKVTLLPNGNISVDEYRTYSFDGNFHWAEYKIPIKGFSRLAQIWVGEVSQDGIIKKYKRGQDSKGGFVVYKDSKNYTIKWFYDIRDESRTFIIHFIADDVIKVYNDTAEFYWKFIGTGWGKGVSDVNIEVKLPPGDYTKNDIKIFAHGPLWGNVSFKDRDKILYTVKKLPAHKFFEGRILMPPNLFPNANLRINKNAYQNIMNEELKWAKEADKKREWAKKEIKNRKKKARYYFYFVVIFGIIIPILMIFPFMRDYFKYGREYKPSFTGDYYRDFPSDDPPAVVSYLMNFGPNISGNVFTATIMDFVRRGYFTLKEDDKDVKFLFMHKKVKDFILTRTSKDLSALKTFEIKVVNLLRNIGEHSVRVSEIKTYAKKHNEQIYTWFNAWKKSIKKESEKRGFIEPESIKARKKWVIISLVYLFAIPIGCFLILFFVIMNEADYFHYITNSQVKLSILSLALGFIIPFVLLVASFSLQRRSKEAVELYAKWTGLKRFLLHFSNMTEAPPRSVIVWEKYLVYATVFGIAKEVIKQLKTFIKQGMLEDMDRSYLFSSFYSGDMTAFANSLDSLTSSIESISNVASSSLSSSGAGGGASGGGGGGGGGSGGGAG